MKRQKIVHQCNGLEAKVILILSSILSIFKGRSPIFSHLTATINGLATIRSRNIQNELVHEFDELQNVHSGVWQLAVTSNTACGLWMDCISTAFVASVTFSFIIFYESMWMSDVHVLNFAIVCNQLTIIIDFLCSFQIHSAEMLVWQYHRH